MKQWYSASEAAKLLGITPRRLRRIIQVRGYPVDRIGHVIVIPRTTLDAIRQDREKRLNARKKSQTGA